nr:DUF21 domain-containing protein [Candidatus Krumholzibacteria bacterium]
MSFLLGPQGEIMWMPAVLVLVVGLLLSAFFSGSETGFMSVSRVRLRRSGQSESGQGRTLQELLRNIEDPILTCLIGTNLFNVMISAVLTVIMTSLLGDYGEWAAVALGATMVITFGEIVPKVLYLEFPETLTGRSVRGIRLAMLVFWPVRVLLLGYTRFLRFLQGRGGGNQESLDRRS